MFIYKAHLKTASADQSAVHIKSVNQNNLKIIKYNGSLRNRK